jgi:hypothetical protein
MRSVIRFLPALVLSFALPASAAQPCVDAGGCNDGNDCTIDACVANVCEWTNDDLACGARLDFPVEGRKVKLHIPPSDPLRNGFRFLATEGQLDFTNLPNPNTEPASDPVTVGGSIRIFTTEGDAFDHTYPLPAEHWDYFPAFNPTDYRGYQYKDAFNEASPIGVVKIIGEKTIKMKGKDNMAFSLDANPDPVQIVLTLGRYRYCFAMGGERFNFKEGKLYWSKISPAPVACP